MKTYTYYYVEISLINKQIVGYGESNLATHDGDTEDAAFQRMFLPKGQYNKLMKKLSEFNAR